MEALATEEIWKPIKGYPDYASLYLVSNLGHIKSLHPHINRNLKEVISPCGYSKTQFWKKRKYKPVLVHRIVLIAFSKNLPQNYKDLQVNHIDGNKLNNRIENLEWCTHSQNQLHAIKIGIKTLRGEKNPIALLTESKVRYIKTCKLTNKELAKLYNVHRDTIYKIRVGINWSHVKVSTNEK